ncbi:NAD(P)-binding protein [Lentzea sp. NPDC051838]|uniref:NAD(P)-binding protein n=1 Tax=Lentzea sp. NPDC051838 TaxID=3154849 RepID=UPI0034408BFC
MASHIVLIGYGDSGRVLLRALQFDPRRARPTVIDVDPERVEQARADGADAVLGFGWRLTTLEAAGVPEAAHVVVAVSDDALALRITSVVRSLNEGITVTTVVRSRNLVDLIQYLGADHVLTEDEFVEWYLELRPESDGSPSDVDDLVVLERAVGLDEIGRLPSECGPEVLAVIRDGRRVWAEDPSADRLRSGDLLVVLDSVPPVV